MTRDTAARLSKASRRAYIAGICLQGIVLGLLMIYALSELWVQAHDVRLFRYQNF